MPAIPFQTIPASGLLVPGFYAEFDNSRASYGAPIQRTLIVAQAVSDGRSYPSSPQLVTSQQQVNTTYHIRSQLARMVADYRLNDSFGELWVMPLTDAGGSAAATGTLTFTGPATAAGTISLYVAGRLASVAVSSGDSATTIAGNVVGALGAILDLPITATNLAGVVTLTAFNKGTLGNAIDIRLNYRGAAAGEVLPAGVGCTIVAMSGGSGDPSLSSLDGVLGDFEFDFIIHPFSDSTRLDAIRTMLSDTTGRWSYLRQVYGHAFTAKADTAANLQTLGAARNDQHHTIIGCFGSPTPAEEIVAAAVGAAAVALRADPARPVQTLAVAGVLAPQISDRFSKSTNNTLIGSGIATLTFDADGTARIQRMVTTYQKNPQNITDRSYLDVETLYLLMAVVRQLRGVVTSRYARAKLADDGTRFGPGDVVVTPSAFKAELVAVYSEMVGQGWVEDVDGFKAATIVQRNAQDPSRLDVLFAPNLISGLRVLALLAQFRL